MKANHKIKLERSAYVIIAMIADIPGREDEEFGDAEGQEINKDPVIGGADDVYRENPTDDLRDSDLVDTEPLQKDIKPLENEDEQSENYETEEADMPSDSEEENLDISNLDDNEDITSGQ